MNARDTLADLLARVRRGDQQAAAELVRSYEPQIRRIVRVRLNTRLRRVLDSADVSQQVLLSFFARAGAGQYDIPSPGHLIGLLAQMARNKLLSHARQSHQEDEPTDSALHRTAARSPGPTQTVIGKDLLESIFSRLSPEERELARLRAEGMTWAEIAGRLGGRPQARRKQHSRALDRVMTELGLEGAGEIDQDQ